MAKHPIFGHMFRGSLLLLNLLVVVLLLLSTSAMFVPPTLTAFPSFFGMGFAVIAVCNVPFVVFWLFTHRREWSVISLSALLLCLPAFLATWSHGNSANPEGKTQLRVLTYNTMSLEHNKPIPQNDVLRYIKESGADVVCLQEYCVRKSGNYPTFEGVKSYLQKDYPYTYFDFSQYNSRLQFGLAVYSKYPLVNKQSINFEHSCNSANRCDILVKNISGKTDTIRLFNTHMQSNHLTADELEISKDERTKEGLRAAVQQVYHKLVKASSKRSPQARAVGKEIARSPYPVIVCGDFNDVPVSYTYHTLSKGLSDAFSQTSWMQTGWTYAKYGLGIRIDYILHSPKLGVADYQTDKVNYSDHYPVSATICW